MVKKILIIGQNGLLGSSLINYFKIKKLNVYSLSFEKFIKKFNKNIFGYDIIINCTSNQNFISNSYQVKNDNDLIIAKKIAGTKIKFVMLSTRKIYKNKFNIKESDKKNQIVVMQKIN